jgi:hypothetical protein
MSAACKWVLGFAHWAAADVAVRQNLSEIYDVIIQILPHTPPLPRCMQDEL